ncbi:hypothetical protein BDV32DRAFT_154229 [Aspergillus pseudonomiae]|uniref:Uncharacterized protein n=1 Tax=Aspergillus pseudonomiae TaxID=1506151 RepID=A0A5N7DJX9_9EURO|nr:uncharacterized protein BDV37DRAFT_280685 [Aspergillus pseudonomiae]KAB8255456.1 hypothetical protein BDV32DRAFT_154229 [Aspergillus pseudonomiae]KAE8406727.1 hypothetical protein BDV37DRAFT_280685 [Aspergillus pseudonomiae]
MTSFKVLFAFLAMFMFSIQTAVALPGNTQSIPSAAAVKNYDTAAQKSPAPAEGEPFQRGKYCYGTCNKQKKCNCQEGKATYTCSCVHPDAKCSCWVV